jgi:hypothetical protein
MKLTSTEEKTAEMKEPPIYGLFLRKLEAGETHAWWYHHDAALSNAVRYSKSRTSYGLKEMLRCVYRAGQYRNEARKTDQEKEISQSPDKAFAVIAADLRRKKCGVKKKASR